MPWLPDEEWRQDMRQRLELLERLAAARFACDECGKNDYPTASAAAACCRD